MTTGKRLLVGFYGDNRSEALDALNSLKRQAIHNVWILEPGKGESGLPRPLRGRNRTLLHDEYLVVGLVPAPLAKGTLDKLRGNARYPTFILKDLEENGEPCKPSPPSDAAFSRAAFIHLAEAHRETCPVPRRALHKTFESAEARLALSYQALLQSAMLGHAVTSTGEWLLDNNYLFEVHGAEVKAHLPRKYGVNVPGVARWAGLPRVHAIACELTSRLDFAVNPEAIISALEAYQSITPLNVAELWLFPVLLRLALFDGISHIAARAAYAQEMREHAYFWTNRLVRAARMSPESLSAVLDTLEKDVVFRSDLFISVLAEQLHEEDAALARFQEKIATEREVPLSDVIRRQHQLEINDRVTVANAIGSLRSIGQIDFTRIFEQVSHVEKVLLRDPAGNYGRSSFATRDECRRAVESLATRSGLAETQVALAAVAAAGEHSSGLESLVGYYLLGDGRFDFEKRVGARPPLLTRIRRWLHRHPTFVYLSLVISLTLMLMAIFGLAIWRPGADTLSLAVLLALAAAFPLSDLSIQVTNSLLTSILPPASLPQMNYEDGIPPSAQTLVVVPMMLVNEEVIRKEWEKLETRYLGNMEPNLHFALLADFTDAASQRTPQDEALLDAARAGLQALITRYPKGRFHLFHRGRTWSESEQCWIGRERKRGKIEDLNAYLCEESSELVAEPPLTEEIAFAITLDADTSLPAESARRLIETIAHPLNRSRWTPEGRRISGYAIIQPRISIGLPGANITRFTRIVADARGTDPYCRAVSDLYQDLFGESIFHGKAIYDVRAMHGMLHNRFPSNTVLSHDLIEGAHVGVAADTRTELFENVPTDYGSFTNRQHRWMRGDWQIAPWIRSRVPGPDGQMVPNPLPLVNRWQILDNLRRSLVTPASMLMLAIAWLFSNAASESSLLIAAAAALPTLAPVIERLVNNARRQTQGTIGVWEELQRTVAFLALLPHQAWLASDAIVRVLHRRWISGRRLLEWQTAESAGAHRHHSSAALRQCVIISWTSLVVLLAFSFHRNFWATAPFLLLWAASPLIVVWLGQKSSYGAPRKLPEEDERMLRVLARRTWRMFDDYVGPDSHWLPPDNVQLSLRKEVAQRTSPSNIGLWMTSLLAAYDFAYLTLEECLRRCGESLATLKGMERYEGHWLNWYDLRSLAPLPPRYVSTVDSGNLLVCLWVLEQGLKDAAEAPLMRSACLQGLASTLDALAEEPEADAAVALPLKNLRKLLREPVSGYEVIDRLKQAELQIHNLKRSLLWMSPTGEAAYWGEKLEEQCRAWLAIGNRFLGWMDTLAAVPDQLLGARHPKLPEARSRAIRAIPSLRALAEATHAEWTAVHALADRPEEEDASGWWRQLKSEYEQSRQQAQRLLSQNEEIVANLRDMSLSIDMSVLYDSHRKLFGIGYELGTPKSFNSHYDLLASECRLASIAAIAKGDAPVDHWQALGRPYVSTGKGQRLLSWSGTMFEYLMPVLFMRPFENSLLAEAARMAVLTQREYGETRRRPWGVSEAAYSALDVNQIYQYRAFGVPDLGFKPGLENDFVVSPYSTALALQEDPRAAVHNLRELTRIGMYGPMGYYESIDYTRPAAPLAERLEGVVIYCYMAHHQGMSLAALANALCDSVMQRRFHGNLRVRSVESLLYERVPATRSLLRNTRKERTPPLIVRPDEVLDRTPDQAGATPAVQLLGNGEYSVLVTSSGGGYSRWRDIVISRWRADSALDDYGALFYLRDARSDLVWSPAVHPLGGPAGEIATAFSSSRVRFSHSIAGMDVAYEICVAPEDPLEVRRFTFINRGLRPRSLDITSYIALAMAEQAADLAHPAFSKMFVETEWDSAHSALLAHRRPRSPGAPTVWAAHVLIRPPSRSIEFESSREKFLGRNRGISNPISLRKPLTQSVGAVLDPAFSIRCAFQVEARERVELAFLTMAGESREQLLGLIEKYAE